MRRDERTSVEYDHGGDCEEGELRRATITDAVRRMAPWCCERASEARATRPEAAEGFRSRSAIVGTSALAECSWIMPPTLRSSSTRYSKFSMCGPTTTGFLARIGSTGFWPPTPQKLLPTTTTLAVEYHSRSSPVEFTIRIHGSCSKFGSERSVNRRFSLCSS